MYINLRRLYYGRIWKATCCRKRKKGLTQKKLAELLEITPTRLNYWEKDKREPDFFMFTKIINILNADANELLGLKQSTNIPKNYDKLNSLGKQKADDYIEILSDNKKYATQNNTVTDDISKELVGDMIKNTIHTK